MFKRPSSRRRTHTDALELNLVPMMDCLVTIIAFLMFSMSFLSLVSIESPVPVVSADTVNEGLKQKPLQLTVTIHEKETEVWSPFERIQSKKVAHTPENKPDIVALHEALVSVKQQFPQETKVVFVPQPGTPYDQLVSIMDSIRTLESTDTPVYLKNEKTGVDEQAKQLFPEIVFGNILGDS